MARVWRVVRALFPVDQASWVYVDDGLMAVRPCVAPVIFAGVLGMPVALGFPIKWSKLRWAPQVCCLGYDMKFATGVVSIPEAKLKEVVEKAVALGQHKVGTKKEIASATRKLWCICVEIRLGRP